MVSTPQHPTEPVRVPCAEYLARLPQGIDSYPSSLVQAAMPSALHRTHAALWRNPALPTGVRQAMDREWDSNGWVPIVWAVTQGILICEAKQWAYAQFLEANMAPTRETMDNPLYRAGARLLSPHLLVMGSARRWNQFHQGSTLKAEKVNATGVCQQLIHDPHVYTPWALGFYAEVFKYVMAQSRAVNPRVVVETRSETQTSFWCSWSPG